MKGKVIQVDFTKGQKKSTPKYNPIASFIEKINNALHIKRKNNKEEDISKHIL